jgi:Protein of unknown function (DUF1566)
MIMLKTAMFRLATIAFSMVIFQNHAGAEIHQRQGGLLYDDVLDITWVQNANQGAGSIYDDGEVGYGSPPNTDGRMTWANAVAWARELTYGGFDDWRLPKMSKQDYVCDFFAPTGACGYKPVIGTSELAHMFYNNLGLKGYPDPNDRVRSSIVYVGNSYVYNLQDSVYWTETTYVDDDTYAWAFATDYGGQTPDWKTVEWYAWAVRDGDVLPVPEPNSAFLLLLGAFFLYCLNVKNRLVSIFTATRVDHKANTITWAKPKTIARTPKALQQSVA